MDKESVELILRNISGNTWHDRYEKLRWKMCIIMSLRINHKFLNEGMVA